MRPAACSVTPRCGKRPGDANPQMQTRCAEVDLAMIPHITASNFFPVVEERKLTFAVETPDTFTVQVDPVRFSGWWLTAICKEILPLGTSAMNPILTAAGDELISSFPHSPPPDPNIAASNPGLVELVGKRIVICEDEGVTQMQLRRTLSKAGMKVVGAAINGQEGVEMTLRERPDIVLMDIRMPVMDGLEASRRILETSAVCIVLLTAYSDTEYQQQAQNYGVSGYVVKPITSNLLLPLLLEAYQRFQSRGIQVG